MSSEREWKSYHWFHIPVLMQGDSQMKNSDCEGKCSMQSFCDYCLPNLNPSFSQPLVLCLPSPSMEVYLHSCLGRSFPTTSPADPGVCHPWLALETLPVPRSHPWHPPKIFLTAMSCGIADAANIREVEVPSVNQVYVTDTFLTCLENISSTSHPDHAVCNELSRLWSTSSQQAFGSSYTSPSLHPWRWITWRIQKLKCYKFLQGMCKPHI